MAKKIKRQTILHGLANKLGLACGSAAMAITPRLPEQWLVSIGTGLGRAFYLLVGKYRRRGLKNLTYAFGTEQKGAQRDTLLRACMEDIGKNFMEVMHAFGLSADQLRQKIEVVGIEHLDRARAEGKGVIAFSAHLGNFILIGPRLIADGYPFSVVARDPKDPRIARFFRDMRERFGIGSIPDKPKRECIAQCLKCLRDNGILFLQIDQNAAPDDPWVDFFGWLVPTFKGPVVFSLRTGAPVLPLFMIRQPGNRLKLVIEPAVTLVQDADKEEEIKKNVALLTRITEEHIRKYPEQWWWLHRRWKKAKKPPAETGAARLPVLR
jgi:Kdo2-lipid IVA lauroyltransferase/acyltransferase